MNGVIFLQVMGNNSKLYKSVKFEFALPLIFTIVSIIVIFFIKVCCRLFRAVGYSLQLWSAVRSDLVHDCKETEYFGLLRIILDRDYRHYLDLLFISGFQLFTVCTSSVVFFHFTASFAGCRLLPESLE